MLGGNPYLAEDNWAGRIIHFLALPIHILAVTFHISLLQVSGQAMQMLIVGEHHMRLGIKEIVIPDPQ